MGLEDREMVSRFLEEAEYFCLRKIGQTESGSHRPSCLMAARVFTLVVYRCPLTSIWCRGHGRYAFLCHIQLCLYNFMFGKHHIKMYKYTYFLITEGKGYWIEEWQIKESEQVWGKWFMYIKAWFKPILPLFVNKLLCEWKILIPTVDFALPPPSTHCY